MSIVFPRPLPDVGYRIGDPFVLQRFTSQSQSGGRVTNIVEYADPLWTAGLTTIPMYEHEMRVVEAWWMSLREGLKSVLFQSPSYRAPAAHRESPAIAATAATVLSLSGGNIVSLSGVPAGLVLQPGDYVSFGSGALRALGRATDVAGVGTTRTVTVEPAPPFSVVQPGASAFFDRAELVMRPVRGSFKVATVQDIAFAASFELVESRT